MYAHTDHGRAKERGDDQQDDTPYGRQDFIEQQRVGGKIGEHERRHNDRRDFLFRMCFHSVSVDEEPACERGSCLDERGAERLVGLLELLADGQVLGAVGLAFPAADALVGKARLLFKAHDLRALKARGELLFHVHEVVVVERAGNVHAARAGHAVAAARAADLFVLAEDRADFFHGGKIRLRKVSLARFIGDAAVLLHHLNGVHAREHAQYSGLVIEPAEPELRGRSRRFHGFEHPERLRGQADELAAAERFHDDHGHALFARRFKAGEPRLRVLV